MSGPVSKRKVTYFYEPTVGDYFYAPEHVMRPQRIQMTHSLIMHYGLHRSRKMEIVKPFLAPPEDLQKFHSKKYIDFLRTADSAGVDRECAERFGLCEDTPVFEGMFKFSQISAGGSIGAAAKIAIAEADIAINWAGGLHHAAMSKASGFCYVNDIVLGILELLKVHQRVLYIDIDVHHGDGVEHAFYQTDRVMTVSFHKYNGKFFPKTGHIRDVGEGLGNNYSINVPLQNGIDDLAYNKLFEEIIQKAFDVYQPNVIVLQSGADSLGGDWLGKFNLSMEGHANCLRFVKKLSCPLMVLGGGGYTVKNVARCWCLETAVALGLEDQLNEDLPASEYIEYYGPDFQLHEKFLAKENLNKVEDLEMIRVMVLEQLGKITPASVQFHATAPVTAGPEEEEPAMDHR